MMWRLKNLPTHSSMLTRVDAKHYNAIRRAAIGQNELRLTLINTQHIVLIANNNTWICADAQNQDIPIAAWTDFETDQRSGLHLPVTCKKIHYHYSAERISKNALNLALARLNDTHSPAPACRLRKTEKHWQTKNNIVLTCI